MYVASTELCYDPIIAIWRKNRLSWLRTKSYVYLQSNVTTGSYIIKRSVLQSVTDRIATTLSSITT